MILTENYVEFLIEHKLTQSQYLLLQLLYERRVDLIRKYKKAFPIENGKMISDYLLDDLFKRGYLTRTETGIKLGNKFYDAFVDIHKATDEIYDLYPAFINNNGIDIPLIAMDKRVFREIYIKKINGSLREHEEIKKDIQYAIDNNLIKTGLNKFLTSELWKAIRKLRAASIKINVDNDFDTDF